MALEDIERLREKIGKDPNSKLFIPLAEEYKKAGMFDDAIDVLIKGLKRQPGYMSAHVSLGKIYFGRGMLEEARTEFERVISTIPDNLYAHKKLAEIYSDLGDRDRAVEEFKTVLKLNPMDEWAATSLADIEEGTKPYPEVPANQHFFKGVDIAPSETVEVEAEELPSEPPPLSLYDADPYILQDKYIDAMKIYRKLISLEPGNMHVMQRVEELKFLLRLLGKDKEELIARLDSFLGSIKKRHDEFFGST